MRGDKTRDEQARALTDGISFYSMQDCEAMRARIKSALAEAEWRLFKPLQWQAIWDALAFTAQHAGCVSDAHNEVADIVEAKIAECERREQECET